MVVVSLWWRMNRELIIMPEQPVSRSVVAGRVSELSARRIEVGKRKLEPWSAHGMVMGAGRTGSGEVDVMIGRGV